MGISLKVITPNITNTTEAAKMKYLFIREKAITFFNAFIIVVFLKVTINYLIGRTLVMPVIQLPFAPGLNLWLHKYFGQLY